MSLIKIFAQKYVFVIGFRITRNQILERVWGYDFMGDSNIIEVYVRYLRLKLEAEYETRLIHTV
nr:winged helix-turn-helix domain-containing protein [Stanieria cyanosphaera]